MKLCNETITVFNARLDPETDSELYYGTVINGVSWYCRVVTAIDSTSLNGINEYVIRIPADADFSGKAFIKAEEYDGSNPETVFTLRPEDIIVKGACAENAVKLRILQERYTEKITVLGVTDNRRAPNAKHWKVVGK